MLYKGLFVEGGKKPLQRFVCVITMQPFLALWLSPFTLLAQALEVPQPQCPNLVQNIDRSFNGQCKTLKDSFMSAGLANVPSVGWSTDLDGKSHYVVFKSVPRCGTMTMMVNWGLLSYFDIQQSRVK